MRTLADTLLPAADTRGHTLSRDALLVTTGSLLIALCAKMTVPMVPVPMTMQPFAILLVAAALGSRRGALAVVAYLLEGLAGLPVFAGPLAGWVYFAGPTGGYLLAFPLAAYLVGRLAELGWDRSFPRSLAAMTAGQAVILALGFLWLTLFVGTAEALTVGVVPFLLGDVLKIALAAIALPAAWRLIRKLQ